MRDEEEIRERDESLEADRDSELVDGSLPAAQPDVRGNCTETVDRVLEESARPPTDIEELLDILDARDPETP